MAISVGRKSTAAQTSTLKPGDKAPDFELANHRTDDKVKLSSFAGKAVLLAFYPFAFTPV